ncbi:MAG: TRAM domain-containing protein [Thaumarchaeota archaeon]|nr:TRAM domain-containing protein [Nitrososphaerota archaeon]
MQDQPQRYPSRRFPSAYFKAKPVKIGDELDVTISEISRRGDGLTRVDGYVIFVPNTKQGDSVKVKITQIRPNYAIGEIKT